MMDLLFGKTYAVFICIYSVTKRPLVGDPSASWDILETNNKKPSVTKCNKIITKIII